MIKTPRPRVYTDHHGDTDKTYCQGPGCIQIMETHGLDILPRPRAYTDHHGDTWSRHIVEAKVVYRSSWRHIGLWHIAKAKVVYNSSSWRTHTVKTYCQGPGCIQIIIIMGTHTLKAYCRGKGYMQIISWRHIWSWHIAKSKGIYRSSWRRGQDIAKAKCIYRSSSWGDIWSRHIAEAKGMYRSSWTQTVMTYCQGQGYLQIIIMETQMFKMYCWSQGYIQIIIMDSCTGEVVLLRLRVYTCSKFYAHYIHI